MVGTSAWDFPVNVLVMSYNVQCGAPDAGFTVTGGNSYGVRIDQGAYGAGAQFHASGAHISISGNADVGDGTGFSFQGIHFEDNLCNAPVPCLPAAIAFSWNQATDNAASGFDVLLNMQPSIGGALATVEQPQRLLVNDGVRYNHMLNRQRAI